ncbi:MAG: type II toxin-antitoxin system HicA family toxin [Selenomonadaceae bacterium]|nr:type II toxin-antitoxin system HicA family toxin [Selenomonadaceae bacterium]MBQ7630621.1 type II toxin-antitoxin system HicA family toxin [Selenomonadaceae bacterium]
MKSYSSDEVIKILKADGWYLERVRGDHHQFKHSVKKGTVTVQHPVKDLNKNVLKSIARQSGLDFK